MTIITVWLESIANSLINLWDAVLGLALPVVGSVVVLYAGWIIGRLFERFVNSIAAKTADTDMGIANSSFGKFLGSMGSSLSIGALFGWIAWAGKWFFYVSFFTAAMSVLALSSVTAFIGEATAFFPKALSGALFILIGVILARFLQSLIQKFLGTFKLPGSEVTGTIAYWVVFIFAFLAMLNYFGLPFQNIGTRVLDMLVIGGGIAIGLGFSGRLTELLERLKKGL